ncbi:Basement membrane-specific heparan sulfate proteoglycan core protein [Armadillidium vulgare]|nr:Basement membrane-specific heparan sulfate proteoglycan core protein [Armadillidium vulgare]
MRDLVNDDKWHSVSIYRKGKTSTMYLDGKSYKKSTDGDFVQLNTPNIFYIGGIPNGNSLRYTTDFHFTKSFVGCLKDVILHPLSPTLTFSSVKRGQDLQPCFT